jgi:hypothetical protein
MFKKCVVLYFKIGQSITWSSSEDEKVEKIVPVVKKPKRQKTPKTSAPARRSTRRSNVKII